ncbi:LPS export ABC transporter periplasmic protein LptC [Spirosoma pollinicola]|uniref:LPS export ABC transporter periplasmic protein LptC n=1 Tax=Spirosoma pollinicola TaxID=2057025 RepID=A0A2K8YVE3_9BACT|nr:LPS export ABC transporter periplasmic protein LptC [Spirosoma pollinicola]AUD01583.1 LPS export ABC transporter periplasmic protein LptC [Spirosoma pollinicola]
MKKEDFIKCRKRTTWLRTGFYSSFIILNLSFLLLACEEKKQVKNVNPYSGPIEEINDVKLFYSEAAKLKVKLITAKQFRYLNDNRRYPKPVNISFYSPTGEEITTIRSDSGRYDKAKDLYTVMGNVVVINKQKQEKLLTPELNWKPTTKKVFTDKRVTVLSQLTGEKLYGIGLDANQDFSQYSIRKPTGVFNVEGGI